MEDNDAASPPWADLPADAVSEIAGRLQEATSFVRFHAVCKPWRQAPPPPHGAPSFFPCLIGQVLVYSSFDTLHLHSPFSSRDGRPGHTGTSTFRALAGKKLKGSDAATGRVLAVGVGENERRVVLVNPLTGDITCLPALPETIDPRRYMLSREFPSGVATNGTVMLYANNCYRFPVLLLRPGETDRDWEEVDVRNLSVEMAFNGTPDRDGHTRRAVILRSSGALRGGGAGAMARLPQMKPGTSRHVLESLHGELLCLDVLGFQKAKSPALMSMTVHALEVHDDDRKPHWVKIEHGVDADTCLFLNRDGSGFAVDAREFGAGAAAEVTGGCAYFVDDHPTQTMRDAAWRYNFQDGTARVVDELPAGFGIACMWYKPHPRISALRPPQFHKRESNDDGYSQPPVRSRPRLQPPVHSQCAQ